MIALLLILIPFLSGIAAFFIKKDSTVRSWALFSAILTLGVAVLGLTCYTAPRYLHFRTEWMQMIGSSFSIGLDDMGYLLSMLTAIAFPLIFVATWRRGYRNAFNFFAWMLLAQAGLIGVFLAMDALLFYFFWELALIPMYFICSQWGGEKRIPVTFKFFIYTFTGSVLMLTGILYVYFNGKGGHSFDIAAFYKAGLTGTKQNLVFWLFFVAFAIKMPIFPFHTWQPDTYEQSPTAATMVLSGVMVKMGILGLLRWVMPVLPTPFYLYGDTISWMAVIGIVYASLIAMRQDDIKRLIAYSSIAHIGLMCLTIFAQNKGGMQGVMIQMFNHGINIIGLWMIVEMIERQFGVRKMSQLGGLAQKAPVMAIFFVIIAFANIALPLTNAFIGEFLMFNGLISSTASEHNLNIVFAVLAGLGIIFGAIYTLGMTRKIFYGQTNELTAAAHDLQWNEKIILSVVVVAILVVGVYPQPLLQFTNGITDTIINSAAFPKGK